MKALGYFIKNCEFYSNFQASELKKNLSSIVLRKFSSAAVVHVLSKKKRFFEWNSLNILKNPNNFSPHLSAFKKLKYLYQIIVDTIISYFEKL